MTAFICHSGKGKVYRDKEQITGCQGIVMGEICLERSYTKKVLGNDGIVLFSHVMVVAWIYIGIKIHKTVDISKLIILCINF